jgi:acetyltransferase-like isoleucine patch superfamily enzyme
MGINVMPFFHRSSYQEYMQIRRYEKALKLIFSLREKKMKEFNRHVPIGDLFSDRSETAEYMGFGENTTCYNSVIILGEVSVGKNCWIGPNVILDGSGGLSIGDWVTISAGAQIYSHSSIDRSVSKGKMDMLYAETKLEDGCYVGPNSIVSMGVTIGESAIIGANSFVRQSVKAGAKVIGNPAKEQSAT